MSSNSINLCRCGCGQIVTSRKKDGSLRQFVHGHNNRGGHNMWSQRPNSEKERTGRWRARRDVDASKCILAYTGECKGPIDVHHQDKNPMNNSINNVVAVCRCHHIFLDNGKITLDNPWLPEFCIDSSGKRRYESE